MLNYSLAINYRILKFWGQNKKPAFFKPTPFFVVKASGIASYINFMLKKLFFIFAHIAKSTKKRVNKTHSKNTKLILLNKRIVFYVLYEK